MDLCSAPVLRLANYKKDFLLYVTERGSCCVGPGSGVWGRLQDFSLFIEDIGFGGTRITSTFACHGWRCSLRADCSENGSNTLILHSSHQVTSILNYIHVQHMTAQQRTGYEVILCVTQNVTIKPTSVPNTPTVVLYCLINSIEPVTENTQDCLAEIHISSSLSLNFLDVPSERFCV